MLATLNDLLLHKALRNEAVSALLSIGPKLPDAVVRAGCLQGLQQGFDDFDAVHRKEVDHHENGETERGGAFRLRRFNVPLVPLPPQLSCHSAPLLSGGSVSAPAQRPTRNGACAGRISTDAHGLRHPARGR